MLTQSPTPAALGGLRLLPSQPRVAHSLCPLGYDHLVAGGPGERGDRRPGSPDPLPGPAPGCPGPVVFRLRPGAFRHLLCLKFHQEALPLLGTWLRSLKAPVTKGEKLLGNQVLRLLPSY